MKIYIEKVYEVENIKQGAVSIIIHKNKPSMLIPKELLEEIEVADNYTIIVD